ncbi:MAG: HAD-IG family 5'-nucleotidase [Sandaracinaceae bacterium]|nr:HAD-IG family 5'-nucleotidase [Sandaracinaceae bacterium]
MSPSANASSDPLATQLTLPLPELNLLPASVRPPPLERRVFCNRNLRLDRIEVVGFDMDYTLAHYHRRELGALLVELAIEKLVARGYPESFRALVVDQDFPIRGLLVDLRLGNLLKMDRYKYVKRAFHGLVELTREERRAAYHTHKLRPSSGRYVWLDALGSLPEVSLFAAAVDAVDRGLGNPGSPRRDYASLFRDVRAAVDECTRDGSLRKRVVDEPDRYLDVDPALGAALHRLRSAGKRLFLLTDSDAAYTDAIMAHLLGRSPDYPSYHRYFDWVITDAQKPAFFTSQTPFREVLRGGALGAPVAELERGRVYAGGCLETFEQALGVVEDRVLYVGDHIHGDVLRAKKETAWRTMMVIQEMDAELLAHQKVLPWSERLLEQTAQREGLLDAIHEHQARIKTIETQVGELPEEVAAPELVANRARLRKSSDKLRARLRELELNQDDLEERIAQEFHPGWGSLFKEGTELSSFGHQLEVFACLYTSRVSNLFAYSPTHYFRSPRDRMPHELSP